MGGRGGGGNWGNKKGRDRGNEISRFLNASEF